MHIPGLGIIKGLKETARNFLGSFHDPERFTTLEYPEQTRKPAENYRSFPFLVYDGEDPVKGLRCVSCKICEKECPPQCIYIVNEKDAQGKPMKHPRIYDLDISVCMSCQICVEVCPFDAIKMDQVFEIAETNRYKGLMLTKKQLVKPNSYYHKIHPGEAEEVDAQLEAERQRKAASAQPKPAPAVSAPAAPSAASAAPPLKTSDKPQEKGQ